MTEPSTNRKLVDIVTDFIVQRVEPLSIVQDEAFQKFCRKLMLVKCPRDRPGRCALQSNLDEKLRSVKVSHKKQLSEAAFVCLAADV